MPLPSSKDNPNADLDLVVIGTGDNKFSPSILQQPAHSPSLMRSSPSSQRNDSFNSTTTPNGGSPSEVTNELEVSRSEGALALSATSDWLARWSEVAEAATASYASNGAQEMTRSLSFGYGVPIASSSNYVGGRPAFFTQMSMPCGGGYSHPCHEGLATERSIKSASSDAESTDYSVASLGAMHGKSVSEQDERGRIAQWHLRQAQLIHESLRAEERLRQQRQRTPQKLSSVTSSAGTHSSGAGKSGALRRTQSSKRAKSKVGNFNLVAAGTSDQSHSGASTSPHTTQQLGRTDGPVSTSGESHGQSQSLPPSQAPPADFDPYTLHIGIDEEQLEQINQLLESHAAQSQGRQAVAQDSFSDQNQGNFGASLDGLTNGAETTSVGPTQDGSRSASGQSVYSDPLASSRAQSPLSGSLYPDLFESVARVAGGHCHFEEYLLASPTTSADLGRQGGWDSFTRAVSNASTDLLSSNSITSGSDAGQYSQPSEQGRISGTLDRLRVLSANGDDSSQERRSFMTSNIAAMQLAALQGEFDDFKIYRESEGQARSESSVFSDNNSGLTKGNLLHGTDCESFNGNQEQEGGHSHSRPKSFLSPQENFFGHPNALENSEDDLLPRTETIQPRGSPTLSRALAQSSVFDSSSYRSPSAEAYPTDDLNIAQSCMPGDDASNALRRPRSTDTLREVAQIMSTSDLHSFAELSSSRSIFRSGASAIFERGSISLERAAEHQNETHFTPVSVGALRSSRGGSTSDGRHGDDDVDQHEHYFVASLRKSRTSLSPLMGLLPTSRRDGNFDEAFLSDIDPSAYPELLSDIRGKFIDGTSDVAQ